MALKVRHQPKPEGGVTVSQIPAELTEAMVDEWKYIQANPDHEVVLEGETKAEADQYLLYARAWGKGQTPRLEVRRAVATKHQPENEVRMTIRLYDAEAPRPGRPAASR